MGISRPKACPRPPSAHLVKNRTIGGGRGRFSCVPCRCALPAETIFSLRAAANGLPGAFPPAACAGGRDFFGDAAQAVDVGGGEAFVDTLKALGAAVGLGFGVADDSIGFSAASLALAPEQFGLFPEVLPFSRVAKPLARFGAVWIGSQLQYPLYRPYILL
jgi:hypothetical protein